jgi:hypothetical protein
MEELEKYIPQEILSDLLTFEKDGMWTQGVPQWAKDVAKKLHVATGSIHIFFIGYEYIAKSAAKELGWIDSTGITKKYICALRRILDAVAEKFNKHAYVEIYEDGSGLIRDQIKGILAQFDGLGELATILGE